MGALSSQTDVSGATSGQAKTQILASIAALTSDTETKVTALCTAWDAASLNVGSIQGGGVTDVQGLNFSWDDKRAVIRQRMQIYLPYYRHHEVLARMTGNNGGSIQVIR
jgi:hypothetical protein